MSEHSPADPCAPANNSKSLVLHYSTPASSWVEALPVGNGRLGGMVYGRLSTELIQLNEDSVWYGGPQERTPRDAYRYLPRLRRLIREEKHKEAESLVRESFFSCPASMRHYEPLGNCSIESDFSDADVTDYSRQLDLETAQQSTRFRRGNVLYRRDVIASFPDQVLLIRLQASRKSRFVLRLNRLSEVEWETNEFLDSIGLHDNQIVLKATPGGQSSNKLALVLGVSCELEEDMISATSNCLVVETTSCVIAIGAQTTFRAANPEELATSQVNDALSTPWDVLVQRHRRDYAQLFTRVSLRMWPDASDIPTDERLKTRRDPGLVALYHNYGRYLLISSSRDGQRALPANLQGIWNPSFAPAWGSRFTININLQMNYWPAAMCGIMVCVPPLMNLLEAMAKRGETTAKEMYGCRGWCSHHNTDIWGDTDPQDRWMPATLWPLGGVWLCNDVVNMLQHDYDRDLHQRLAPILEGCVLFLLDFLVESACGTYLVTSPSLSPENTFVSETGDFGILCEGSAMDMTIVRMAFESFLWSTNILGQTHSLCREVEAALGRLPPLMIGDEGRIQEWGLKDYGEHEPGHRHVSHLLGLHPGHFIHPTDTPELADAAVKVLERRQEHGGGHTGWSRAWLVNLHARLFDRPGCEQHMDLLLKDSTLPNLLDSHPPFQIDGNFGGCAGVIECLVQSRLLTDEAGATVVEVRLLPSCPASWRNGKLTGFRVMGNWVVSFEWEDRKILTHNLEADHKLRHTAAAAYLIMPDGYRIYCPGASSSKT